MYTFLKWYGAPPLAIPHHCQHSTTKNVYMYTQQRQPVTTADQRVPGFGPRSTLNFIPNTQSNRQTLRTHSKSTYSAYNHTHLYMKYIHIFVKFEQWMRSTKSICSKFWYYCVTVSVLWYFTDTCVWGGVALKKKIPAVYDCTMRSRCYACVCARVSNEYWTPRRGLLLDGHSNESTK